MQAFYSRIWVRYCVCSLVFMLIPPMVTIPESSPAQDEKKPLVIETTDGTTYEVRKIYARNAQKVKFMHAAGVSTYHAHELTYQSRKLLGMEELPGATHQATPATSIPSTLPDFTPSSQPTACAMCRGAGTIRCRSCLGTGYGKDQEHSDTCSACNGSGKTSKPVYRQTSNLDRWGNTVRTGQKNTHVIDYQSVPCSKCNGTGSLSSKSRGYCSVCNGTGYADCPRCP